MVASLAGIYGRLLSITAFNEHGAALKQDAELQRTLLLLFWSELERQAALLEQSAQPVPGLPCWHDVRMVAAAAGLIQAPTWQRLFAAGAGLSMRSRVLMAVARLTVAAPSGESTGWSKQEGALVWSLMKLLGHVCWPAFADYRLHTSSSEWRGQHHRQLVQELVQTLPRLLDMFQLVAFPLHTS